MSYKRNYNRYKNKRIREQKIKHDEQRIQLTKSLQELDAKYRNNPVAFAEDMFGAKLHTWQKLYLNAVFKKDNIKCFFNKGRSCIG